MSAKVGAVTNVDVRRRCGPCAGLVWTLVCVCGKASLIDIDLEVMRQLLMLNDQVMDVNTFFTFLFLSRFKI